MKGKWSKQEEGLRTGSK